MSILALPDEIVRDILSKVDSQNDRLSLAKTCRRLHSLVLPFIYESMKLNVTYALRFFRSPFLEPVLGFVKSLTLEDPKTSFAMGFFAPMIEQMSNLESLQIISPYWHFGEFGNDSDDEEPDRYDANGDPISNDTGGFRIDWPYEQDKLNRMFERNSLLSPSPRILPSLISCHIEYQEQNGQLWFIDFEPIFFSSTLVKLSLDGCYFHDGDFGDYTDSDGKLASEWNGVTPLKHLVLWNCNVNTIALSKILAIPKALEILEILQTENTHHEMAPSNTLPKKSEEWVHPFTLQQDSLRELYVDDESGRFEDYFASECDFRHFHTLQALNIGTLEEIMSKSNDVTSNKVKLPPSLLTVRLQDYDVNLLTTFASGSEVILYDLIPELELIAATRKHCPHLKKAVVPLQLYFRPGDGFSSIHYPTPSYHSRQSMQEDSMHTVQTITDKWNQHYLHLKEPWAQGLMQALADELRKAQNFMSQEGMELQILLRSDILPLEDNLG